MPYKKEVHRILSGSINLVAPSSEIPDHDAQKMENFTYDSVGNLRSRKGHEDICSASDVLQMIKALDARWQATEASVLKDCESIIAVADAMIVGYKGFLWAMSQSGQRKSTGDNDWRWIPEPPENKPVIETAPDVVTVVSTFTEDEEWTVDLDADDDDDDDTGIITYTDLGMRIQGSDDTVISATRVIVEDPDPEADDEDYLNLYDGQDKDDIFKIKLRCKKWSKIAGVSFEVDVSDGTFTNDYYKVRMLLKDIKAARKEAVTIYIRKRELEVDIDAKDKFLYGTFSRIGQTTNKDWRSVVSLRVKVEFTKATRFWFTSWDMIGDADNTLEGDDIGVYYTYTTEKGHESNPSPKSDLITVKRGSVMVSEMEDSDDPQVTGKNIYLTGGTLGAVLRCNGARDTVDEIEGPITEDEYHIVASEDELTAFGIEMETNHDDPPEAAVLAGPYYDRLFAACSEEHPERVWWTPQSKPFCFPGANSDFFGNWNDVGDTSERVMALSVRSYKIYIYKENSVHYLLGDPGDEIPTGNWNRSSSQMGISSRNGYCQAGPIDYAHMSEGLYRFDGDYPTKISQKIDPIFKGLQVDLSDGTVAEPLSDITDTALGFRDNVLWFSYTAADGRKTLKLDVESSRWSSDSRGFTAFFYEGQGGFFVGALSDGGVVGLESGTSDGGAAIEVDYLTKDYDIGQPDTEKTFEDFTIESQGATGLAVTAYLNGTMPDAFNVALGAIPADGRQILRFDANGFGIKARTIAIKIAGAVAGEIALINKLILNWYEEAREGKAYDTDEFDAGTHKMKRIRAVAIDADNQQSILIQLFADQPGFVMSLQSNTGVIAATSARRREVYWFDIDHIGHLMRLVFKSEEQKIYKAEALIQVIGTWLHGSREEYYSSDPIDFGSERVKLAKEIEIIYAATGGGALLTLRSDLPGDSLEVRGTYPIPASTAERSLKIPLVGYIKGRIWQIDVEPESGTEMRIEAIRMNTKMIGQPSATPWGWLPYPVESTQPDGAWHELKFGKDALG